MRISVHPTPAELGAAVADRIFEGMTAAHRAGRPYLLGCPSGRSPGPVYSALADRVGAVGADLSRLVLVMMDEYVEDYPSSPALVSRDRHCSCRGFAEREIVARFNETLPPDRQIPAVNVWFPELDDPAAYDEKIAAAGGIDMFILASGASDGHVAFNRPGSPREGPSLITELAETTRIDNLQTFPEFRDLSQVPRFGITVGVGTIVMQSKSAAMVLWGGQKQLAFAKISSANGYDPSWPATIVTECRNAVLFADEAAARAST